MSARFDVAKAEGWLEELRRELNLETHDQACTALRAGLHALRDRLTVEEAAHLAAQLPLVIRGVFFEGWHPSGKPLRVRTRHDFISLVERELPPAALFSAEAVVRAVFGLLRRHLSNGMIANVEHELPRPIVELLEG